MKKILVTILLILTCYGCTELDKLTEEIPKSSTLTFNVNWKDITATKSIDETMIEDAVSKGYKLYLLKFRRTFCFVDIIKSMVRV